jgi:hypothetical protein
MLRTARLTEALRARGKTMAISAVAVSALAGAGSASAVLTSGPTPVTGHLAAATAHLTAPGGQSKQQPAATTPAAALPIGHVAPVATPVSAAPAPAPAQPSTIYDSVTPSSIPSGAKAAVYSDGTYATSPAQVAGHPNTLWIDTNGSNPKANVLDVEPGDATPQQAATWVQQKLTGTPAQTAIVYTYRAEWQATQQAISSLPHQMQSHVKWWIADPTGVPHIVPGSDATQWYWGQNYDQSLANPGF